MKKSILNIGKALSKEQQQKINGGGIMCAIAADCIACAGFPGPNGTCFGDIQTFLCCDYRP